MKYYLAIDLGASSGRHIVGCTKNEEIILDEVHRFKTGMDDSLNGLVWDIPRLYQEILEGIKLAFKKYKNIESLSIDTWGVDYVLMNKEKEIPPFYAYRNKRCLKASDDVHKMVSFENLYENTGIQFASFNTIYQLYNDLKKGRLSEATDYLMLPSYFIYKLTGIKTHEYTNESTGSLLNALNKEYDYETLDKLNFPKKLFGEINQPEDFVGELLPLIQKQVGGNTKVYLCASHDTASAFESIDTDDDSIILSSGTWSLLGIKSKKAIITSESLKANYTNEGGVGYIRFLKNIMGMWIANRVKKEIHLTQEYINENIFKSNYKMTFNVNDESLLSPINMKEAVLKLLPKDNQPKNDLEVFSSIYRSMALAYKNAVNELEKITSKKYKAIHVLGGGAKNDYLNSLIKEYTNLKVVVHPIEATALGNIKIQMKASKEL